MKTPTSKSEVLAWLKKKGSKRIVAGMARYGIPTDGAVGRQTSIPLPATSDFSLRWAIFDSETSFSNPFETTVHARFIAFEFDNGPPAEIPIFTMVPMSANGLSQGWTHHPQTTVTLPRGATVTVKLEKQDFSRPEIPPRPVSRK